MQAPRPELQCLIVADSEALIRNALADYLRACGYRVIEAANSEELMAVLHGRTVSPDAILCDALLAGGTNPFELRIWVHQHRPGIRMILAGNVDAAAKAAGHICEKSRHLGKPYDHQTVARRIKRLLATRR